MLLSFDDLRSLLILGQIYARRPKTENDEKKTLHTVGQDAYIVTVRTVFESLHFHNQKRMRH